MTVRLYSSLLCTPAPKVDQIMCNQRTPSRWRFRALALATLVIALTSPSLAPGSTDATVEIGETVREAAMQGLNGPSRQLSQFRGRPLLINVWASWCDPCRAEMASLERLAWLDPARPFNIIGISTDDDAARARDWLKQSNATISQYLDSGQQLERMLGASRIPLTVLVDARGRVVQKIYGAREWDSAESLLLIRRAFRSQR